MMNKYSKLTLVGWILTGLLGAFLLGVSAAGKFIDFPHKEEMFAKMGFTIPLIQKIGVLEIIITILYLIPRTAFLGAILLTAYLGGATVTHVRVGEPFFFQPLLGVLVWVALALRYPAIFDLALGRGRRAENPNTPVLR